jgi:hypothetical protein
MLTPDVPPNNSFDPTGFSVPFIVKLSVARLCSGGSIRALDTLRMEQENQVLYSEAQKYKYRVE